MEIKSTAEIEIQKFVINYGAEQLISWLKQFDKVINSRDYPLYRSLEREACKACGISLSDMHMFSLNPCTNCKRIISFVAFHQLKLSVPSIANLLNMSERSINNYIKEVEDWISAPKGNKVFIEQYNHVIENFKIE